MAATATKNKSKAKIVVFEHVATEGVVLITPGRYVLTEFGREEHLPVYAKFTPQQADPRDPDSWVGRFVVDTDDELIVQQFGMSREKLLERLRSHGANANNPRRVSADFRELEPSVFAPDPGETVKKIARLAAARNVQGLQELLDKERDGFEREDVIVTCEEALMLLEPAPPA